VAQLVAHLHGMQGVRGSNPLRSTARAPHLIEVRGSSRSRPQPRGVRSHAQAVLSSHPASPQWNSVGGAPPLRVGFAHVTGTRAARPGTTAAS
jgi:hypothetical protein